jgi:predicted DNA-binding transcriptional regulator
MANDKAVGGTLFIGSIVGVILYGLLMWFYWETTIRVTAFLAVALLLVIVGWIGYTMFTTPPPEPLAEIPEMGSPAGDVKAKGQ